MLELTKHDICMHAWQSKRSSLFELVKITMAMVDSQALQALRAILSWMTMNFNAITQTIIRLSHPLIQG